MNRDDFDDRDDEVSTNVDRYGNGALANGNRRPRIPADYDDIVYGDGDALNLNDSASEYISETAARAVAGIDWLEPVIGIFDGLFSGNGVNEDLFSVIPEFARGNATNLSDKNQVDARVFLRAKPAND